MSRVSRTLVAWLMWFGACTSQVRPQAPHQVVTFDSLIAQLDSIADTASIEHYRCLLGWRRADSLLVAAMWAPPIVYADYNAVTPAVQCPDGSVGIWHNHLPYTVPMNDPHNRSTKVEPWSVCELSPIDRRSAMLDGPVLQIISVANGVHCAWLRASDSTLTRLPWAAP
jgi:hypothetical protein